MGTLEYWQWIREEAARINSDGCTVVADFYINCCFEHDLSYHYKRDPRDAYVRFLNGCRDYWCLAAKISRSDADNRFRECIQYFSPLKGSSPMSKWRWLGVRLGGWWSWMRKKDACKQQVNKTNEPN